MTTLKEINREEWASKPFLIELRGGPTCGRRFNWSSLPMVWRQPVTRPMSLDHVPESELTTTRPSVSLIADYRETGSVSDDGAHIYEFDRYE